MSSGSAGAFLSLSPNKKCMLSCKHVVDRADGVVTNPSFTDATSSLFNHCRPYLHYLDALQSRFQQMIKDDSFQKLLYEMESSVNILQIEKISTFLICRSEIIQKQELIKNHQYYEWQGQLQQALEEGSEVALKELFDPVKKDGRDFVVTDFYDRICLEEAEDLLLVVFH
eukprot:m.242956 g.242956  ORF g.242956 m.242956 type:complete len:170 (+) comp40230_c0_seq2:518-1027(+)